MKKPEPLAQRLFKVNTSREGNARVKGGMDKEDKAVNSGRGERLSKVPKP